MSTLLELGEFVAKLATVFASASMCYRFASWASCWFVSWDFFTSASPLTIPVSYKQFAFSTN
jgi:hypothetical protein